MKWSLIKVSDNGGKADYWVVRNYSNTKLYWSELDLPIAPRTTITNNVLVSEEAWPAAAKHIIDTSGLEPTYQDLFDRIPKEDR